MSYCSFPISPSFADPCHPYEPFKCPGSDQCISIQYLCDGAPDCDDGYDEDARLCTAGKSEENKHAPTQKPPSTIGRQGQQRQWHVTYNQSSSVDGGLGCQQEVGLWSFSIINRKSWLLRHDRGTYLLGWFSNYVGRRAGPPLNLIKLVHERGSDSNNCVGMIWLINNSFCVFG